MTRPNEINKGDESTNILDAIKAFWKIIRRSVVEDVMETDIGKNGIIVRRIIHYPAPMATYQKQAKTRVKSPSDETKVVHKILYFRNKEEVELA